MFSVIKKLFRRLKRFFGKDNADFVVIGSDDISRKPKKLNFFQRRQKSKIDAQIKKNSIRFEALRELEILFDKNLDIANLRQEADRERLALFTDNMLQRAQKVIDLKKVLRPETFALLTDENKRRTLDAEELILALNLLQGYVKSENDTLVHELHKLSQKRKEFLSNRELNLEYIVNKERFLEGKIGELHLLSQQIKMAQSANKNTQSLEEKFALISKGILLHMSGAHDIKDLFIRDNIEHAIKEITNEINALSLRNAKIDMMLSMNKITKSKDLNVYIEEKEVNNANIEELEEKIKILNKRYDGIGRIIEEKYTDYINRENDKINGWVDQQQVLEQKLLNDYHDDLREFLYKLEHNIDNIFVLKDDLLRTLIKLENINDIFTQYRNRLLDSNLSKNDLFTICLQAINMLQEIINKDLEYREQIVKLIDKRHAIGLKVFFLKNNRFDDALGNAQEIAQLEQEDNELQMKILQIMSNNNHLNNVAEQSEALENEEQQYDWDDYLPNMQLSDDELSDNELSDDDQTLDAIFANADAMQSSVPDIVDAALKGVTLPDDNYKMHVFNTTDLQGVTHNTPDTQITSKYSTESAFSKHCNNLNDDNFKIRA